MSVNGSRVGIVGGSVAGCAMAHALRRAGCTVVVYERSADLKDQGYGIATPRALRDELIARRYIDRAMPVRRSAHRLWVVGERIAHREEFSADLQNWGVLWRALRAGLPDEIVRQGTAVAAVDGTEIRTGDGRRERFDLVVGADGYRSIVRAAVDPEARLRYAGYALWRGNYPAGRMDRMPPELADAVLWIGIEHGHAGCYLIPDFEGEGSRVNWAVYHPAPESVRSGRITGDQARTLDRILDEQIPPRWAEVMRLSTPDEMIIQPIYDAHIAAYAAGRVLLAGDAATVARPHAAAGATKALEDALALEDACRAHDDWDAVLAAYDAERRPRGDAYVDASIRLGDALVTGAPDWAALTPEDFDRWLERPKSGGGWAYRGGG